MKKTEISGIAKVEVYQSKNGSYGTMEINGMGLEALLVSNLLNDSPNDDGVRKTELCKISILVEPYPVNLVVNDKEMPLEL